ncbi:hypothetical protein GCM10012320_14750 [Sinomonas cellulolyticus]|nr:hypothetical protein GCM10012320_14750 [Sinomonas sp. KCTC 49339]
MGIADHVNPIHGATRAAKDATDTEIGAANATSWRPLRRAASPTITPGTNITATAIMTAGTVDHQLNRNPP